MLQGHIKGQMDKKGQLFIACPGDPWETLEHYV